MVVVRVPGYNSFVKSMNVRNLMSAMATALICAVGALWLGQFTYFAIAFDLVAVVALVFVGFFLYHVYLDWQNSRYDLSKLFEERDADEVDELETTHTLFCPNCGIGYPDDWPSCPECGRLNRKL